METVKLVIKGFLRNTLVRYRVPLAIAALGGFMNYGGLWMEGKDVEVQGYTQGKVVLGDGHPFNRGKLEEILDGEDIIPGLPEQGAMCSKMIRALANTFLDEPFFEYHRLFSKIGYGLVGKKKMAGDEAGLYGDAWGMFSHIQKAGGEMLYHTDEPRGEREHANRFVQEHAKIGDILGFYYPDSKFNTVAREAGAGFTHMGMVVGFAQDKDPIIAHLFHSDQYLEPREEGTIEHWRKDIVTDFHKVHHNTIPAMRVETLSYITEELLFNGYVTDVMKPQERTEKEYAIGDQLIYVKTLLRPDY